MPRFRQKPSSRRQARPTASWLVLGTSEARLVVHGQRTTHLTPVKPSHHVKRFLPQQRLSVKSFVGGPTECHVIVSGAERIQLGQVDYGLVRELGYVRLDQFQEAWVAEHGSSVITEDPLERFQARHAHRWVWVVRFAVDRTAAPRLLAQAGRDRASYRKLPDGRWQYAPSAEDAEADRGYTSSVSQSSPGELEVLSDDEWKRHVDSNRDRTHGEWLALARDRARRPERLPKHLRNAA